METGRAKTLQERTIFEHKPDNDEQFNSLYSAAVRAKDARDCEKAVRYYTQILKEKPSDWEALFFSEYFDAINCETAEISLSVERIEKISLRAIQVIASTIANEAEQKKAISELSSQVMVAASSFFKNSMDYYKKHELSADSFQELFDRFNAIYNMLNIVGKSIDSAFSSGSEMSNSAEELLSLSDTYAKQFYSSYLPIAENLQKTIDSLTEVCSKNADIIRKYQDTVDKRMESMNRSQNGVKVFGVIAITFTIIGLIIFLYESGLI